MANNLKIDNLQVLDRLVAKTFKCADSQITNDQINQAAPIKNDKYLREFKLEQAQDYATTVASKRTVVHGAKGLGVILLVRATLAALACSGAATITVDLLKNGSSILSSVLTFNSTTGTTLRAFLDATISVTSYAADDVFEFNVVATAGGGTIGKGLYCEAILQEAF